MNKLCLYLFFIFCVLGSGSPSYAVDKPSTSQRNDFGIVEITSCTSALRTLAPTYMGIEITPAKDWKIQDVNFNLTTSQDLPIDWFTPFKQPFYDRIIYPISAIVAQKPTEPITFTATGTLTACFKEQCNPYTFTVAKTLGTDTPWIVPECDGLTQALAYTPIPMHMNQVKGWAIPNGDQNIVITLEFQHAPKTIQLYDSEKQPLTMDIQVQEKRAQFSWPYQSNDLHFFVRTYYGYYDITLPILPKDTHIPEKHSNLFDIFQAAFLFFLVSAFPIFLARSTDSPYKTFLKQTKQAFILTLLVGITLTIIVYTQGPINLIFYPFNKVWTLILMTAGILFIPAHVTLPFLFTFVAPRPYLNFLQTSFEQLSFIGFTTVMIAAAFLCQWIWAKKIFEKLQDKKTVSTIWWCARMAWIVFMLYLIIYL